MNSEEIDELLKAISTSDFETILKLADVEERMSIEEYIDREPEFHKKIYTKVKQGDYNYFLSKKYDKDFT